MATAKNRAAGAEPAPTSAYTVTSPLEHDGEHYAVGETVLLTALQANELPGAVVKAEMDPA